MSGSGAFGWRAAILCGLLWDVAVTLADTLTQPVVGLTLWQWLYFTMQLLWQWMLAGLIWSIGAKLLAHGRWAIAKLVCLLPLSFAVVIASQWISPFAEANGGADVKTVLVGVIPLTDLATYLLWINTFYGGLYVVGYIATRRSARARRRLSEFRLARNEADLILREARVNAYRGQLQPKVLLEALAALKERYGRDPVEGDRLFDGLIAFLRAAMPSVRGGFSTLGAELETVLSYAALRRLLDVSGPYWRVDIPAIAPALPFPSLILLPALDGLGTMLGEADILSLTVVSEAGIVTLRLSANRPTQLPIDIDRRLRGGLRLTFGSAAQVSAGRDLPLTITLRSQRLDTGSTAHSHQIFPGGINETDPDDSDRRSNAFVARPGE
jgi:hypothetical protein